MKRKILLTLCLAATLVTAIIMWPKAKLFMDVDACLDSGGRYDYALNACDFGKEGA